MRAVFLGTPESAVPTLENLLKAGHEVPLVVTRPDRPVGRSAAPQPPPVKRCAARHGLEVVQPTRIRGSAFAGRLIASRPDVLVVVAYGRILPRRVLEIPRLGPVNVHFSMLPRYRGAAPVQWALARAERATGVTTMLMSERLDEGDVLLQARVPVERGVHAPALIARLADVGASLLIETLEALAAGTVAPRPQDPALATYAPMLRREDGEADFRLTARELEGRVRGFDPWPGVWARRARRRVRIVEAEAMERAADEPPGTVLGLEDDALVVSCGGGTLLAVRAIQPEGRRVVLARDAVNGRHLRPGERLEGPPPAA